MKKVFKFLFLPYQKKKLLCQSLFLVSIIRTCLWIFPYRRLNGWLSYFDSIGFDNKADDWLVIKDVARSVRACSRYVPYASCLTQALAARSLLRLRGQNPQLKIGVEKDEEDKLAAHAWIEIDGRIVIGRLPRHRHFSI